MHGSRFASLAIAAAMVLAAASHAAAATYALELVGKPVRADAVVSFSVQLANEDTGMVVPDATLTVDDFNMEPEGMSGSSTVHPAVSGQPGVFSFEVEPIMAGRWGLVYTAHVPAEPGAITGTLVVRMPD